MSGATTNVSDGEVVTLSINDVSYAPLSAITVASDGSWVASLPTELVQAWSQGSVTITANVSDGSTPAAQATKTVEYDATAPVLEASSPFAVTSTLASAQTTYKDGDTIEVTMDLNEVLVLASSVSGTLVIASKNFILSTVKSDATQGQLEIGRAHV